MSRKNDLWLLGLGLSLVLSTEAVAASSSSTMKKGWKAYEQGSYQEALSWFTEAQVESPDDQQVQFNRSSAQYRTENFEEAAKGFERVIGEAENSSLKEKAFYNLGNTQYYQGNLQGAADSYRQALTLDPSDLEAKQNLEFVLKKIQEQEQQKQKQKQQGQDQKEPPSEGEDQPSKNEQNQSDSQHEEEQTKEGADQTEQQGEQEEESPGEAQEEQKENLGQGEIREAEAQEGEGQDNPEEQEAAAADSPRGMAISAEEAERLLNSLSDDHRAFFRQQAERAAPKSPGKAKDW